MPPFSGALKSQRRREGTSKPESRREAPVATNPLILRLLTLLVLLVLLLGGSGGMGLGKRRELLAPGLRGRAARTLFMCPAEVLRKLLGIVFLELVVFVAEEADC